MSPFLVISTLLSIEVHSDTCETILRVGNTGLADIAEASEIFYAGWKQRNNVPKNAEKAPLDSILIQDCVGPDLG